MGYELGALCHLVTCLIGGESQDLRIERSDKTVKVGRVMTCCGEPLNPFGSQVGRHLVGNPYSVVSQQDQRQIDVMTRRGTPKQRRSRRGNCGDRNVNIGTVLTFGQLKITGRNKRERISRVGSCGTKPGSPLCVLRPT